MIVNIALMLTSIVFVLGAAIAVIEYPKLYITSILSVTIGLLWVMLYIFHGKL